MFDYFDRVYCIHLPNKERREAIEKEFERVGIKDVQYIHATEPRQDFYMSNMRRGPRGELGCSLSHIKAVVQAIADGAERPLFFEDDVIFSKDTCERMREVAHDLDLFPYWDVLYFGGHPRGICHMVTTNLAEIGAFSFAEAYAINGKALLPWLNFWLDRVGQAHAMIDLVLGEFAALRNSYCVYPLLTHQPPGISQISDKFDDKDKCLRKGWATNLCTELNLCEQCRADSAIKSA